MPRPESHTGQSRHSRLPTEKSNGTQLAGNEISLADYLAGLTRRSMATFTGKVNLAA